jgi:hypothetical protein
MAGATERSAIRAGANFELERVEVEDGRLVVSGWWSGVRGMRFVRPALLVDGGRQLLATLEHKPWAPGGEEPWTAAFPWVHDEVDLTGVTLVVAPSITVPLGPGGPAPAVEEPTPEEPAAEEPAAEELPVVEPAPAAPAAPPAEPVPELAEVERLTALVAELETQLAHARSALGSERRTSTNAVAERDSSGQARRTAERERDHAIAQRDEAIGERDAAVRSRVRMESQRDEAVAALQSVESQRDQATAERDEARAQRDEVLLAHRALSQHVNGRLADEERGQPAAPRLADPPVLPDPETTGPDEPIGVRTIPAARMIAGDLHRPEQRGLGPSKYDMWAMRVLGTVAAVCFVLLLVMILRAFI